jgi:hypothetical protein
MVLTISFIADNFSKFNKEYFEGKLKTPTFEITHVKSYLGQYHWKYDKFNYTYDGRRTIRESVIRISDRYDRNETEYRQTILHEMIHLYIRQNDIKDTRPHHGRVFNSIADRINRQGGWHIARTDSVEGCGLTDKTKVNRFYIACFFSGQTGKYFRFRINEKYLDYYKDMFDKYPEHYKNPFIYVSTDDKMYAHYSSCYKSVRGWYISKEEYYTLKETEKVIYELQTLGINHCAA